MYIYLFFVLYCSDDSFHISQDNLYGSKRISVLFEIKNLISIYIYIGELR